MSEDISRLLESALKNPDALKGLLGSASGGGENNNAKDTDTSIQNMVEVLSQNDDRRITLLNALKPYMRGSRLEGIDRAIRLIKISKLSEVMRKERD